MEIKSVYLLIFYNGSETWINAWILGSNERRHQKNESIPRFTFCPSMWPSSHISPLASIPTNFLIKSFSFEFSEVQGKPLQSSFKELLCTSVVIFEMLWPLFTRTMNLQQESNVCHSNARFSLVLTCPFSICKVHQRSSHLYLQTMSQTCPQLSDPIAEMQTPLPCPGHVSAPWLASPSSLPPGLFSPSSTWDEPAPSRQPLLHPSLVHSARILACFLFPTHTPTPSHCKALHVLLSAPHHLSFSMVGPEPSA